MRKVLGWTFFILMVGPVLIAIILEELSVMFQAACEATVQYLVENNNWLKVYKENIYGP